MEPIGQVFRRLRESRNLPLRKVAAQLDIDQAVLSKIERGIRTATRDQVKKIARIFGIEEDDLLAQYYSDRIAYEIANESCAQDALKLAEKKVRYLIGTNRRK